MHHTIAGLSQAGNNGVVDYVLVEHDWRVEYAPLFCDLPIDLVLIQFIYPTNEPKIACILNRLICAFYHCVILTEQIDQLFGIQQAR
ncbi:MAG: hypothetical protein A2Z14_00520 [Chloroflexi bacterium RBG_16_48_8]|nr:MAG: hypothetical protein A2Z14_00520 [Chloroflexi bacterium RBG_16_48_8]